MYCSPEQPRIHCFIFSLGPEVKFDGRFSSQWDCYRSSSDFSILFPCPFCPTGLTTTTDSGLQVSPRKRQTHDSNQTTGFTHVHRVRATCTRFGWSMVTLSKKTFCALSFSYYAPQLWNALPNHIRAVHSQNELKYLLKTYFGNILSCEF